MKANQRFLGVAVVMVTLLVLGAGRPTWGEEKHTAPRAKSGSVLSMAKFYAGPLVPIGDFPGKLVCLRCDLKPGPNAMARCEKEGHRHALSMDGDLMIHPLLAGTEEVLKQINSGELHDKQVSVHGNYYPATGAILVDRISAGK